MYYIGYSRRVPRSFPICRTLISLGYSGYSVYVYAIAYLITCKQSPNKVDPQIGVLYFIIEISDFVLGPRVEPVEPEELKT